MTVRQLIDHLQTFDPTLPIVYSCCSEWTELDAEDIQVQKLQKARKDGWVHNFDRAQCVVEYLTFP